MSKTHSPRKIMDASDACALVLRVYPTKGQTNKASHWLWVAQKFRNEAVAFINDRRRRRGAWLWQHPSLARDWLPEEFTGSDTTACSQWLTLRLSTARHTVAREWAITGDKRSLVGRVSQTFSQLSRGEQQEYTDGWLLTVPRTVLDQIIRDLEKTVAKALSDRRNTKSSQPSIGQTAKSKRLSGFPRHHTHRYPSSIRMQVDAHKNAQFRDHWAAGQLLIPGLGTLKFRDGGYKDLPATPPKLITIARNAAGFWHVSFVCVAGEHKNARTRQQERDGVPANAFRPLPLDPHTGLPAIEGLDASVPHRAVSNRSEALGKTKYLKRYAKRLKQLNKSLARKQKGSGRWKNAKRNLGRLHVRIANLRKAEVISQAQAVASRSAIVCVEDLSLAFMLKNRTLSQSVHEASLGLFKTVLARECGKRGHVLLEAPRFAATTQTCPTKSCGFLNKALKNNLSCRQWTCPQCGTHHDRDIAAAHNIQAMALQAAIDRLQTHQQHHGPLDFSSGPENGLGMLSSHLMSPQRLHPDLAAFIARGGLTALLEVNTSNKSHTGSNPGGLAGAHEARVLPKQSLTIRSLQIIIG